MSDPGPSMRPFELVLSAWTDPGRRRSENQDNFLVADLSIGPGDGGFLLDPGELAEAPQTARCRLGERGLLALVADGMGGAAGGRIASQLAVAWTYRDLVARWNGAGPAVPEDFVTGMRTAIEAANARVHEQGQRTPQYAGMGSTMTAVGLLGEACFVAQVGDSRAYLLRAGSAFRLTRDQSLVQQLVEAGAITPEQAEHSPHGSVLLQALGTAAEVRVELTWHPMEPGDLVLLCSDGLFRMVPDAEIVATASAVDDPAELCRTLVALANERGGPDNVTVVAIRVEADGLAPAAG